MVMALALSACTARGPAPVSERAVAPPAVAAKSDPARPEPARPVASQIAPSSSGSYTVQRGDTLYAIAFANNLDYRDVASWNRLDTPDRIQVGQVLRLAPLPGVVEVKPLDTGSELKPRPLEEPPLLRTPQAVLLAYSETSWAQVTGTLKDSEPLRSETRAVSYAPAVSPVPAPAASAPTMAAPSSPAATTSAAVDSWLWPADGTLIGRFGAAGGKGIDIVGPRNAPVRAVAPGKVVYSGTGLRGYGRLLIIKHPGEFLSAYAHNDNVLVKEGDSVKAGQQIAQMGDSDADRVKLHFEIRRYGKPLDPLDYLPERS